jgi:hypothetical protein
MATYIELQQLMSSPTIVDLRSRIMQATIQKAFVIGQSQQSPVTSAKQWAAQALSDPNSMQTEMLNYVIAANSAKTTTEIAALTDAQVQVDVNNAVDKLLLV